MPNETTLQKMHRFKMTKPYEPDKILPNNMVVCCPFCEHWPMERAVLPNWIVGWKCTGPIDGPFPCGRFLSKEAAEAHKALYVVER